MMLGKFLKSRRILAPLPAIPPGERVYAVGDIHGCDTLLEELLAAIDADDAARAPARTTLIFLGDFIDRGPASAGVVERLRALAVSRDNVRLLLGNHEEIFLGAIDGDSKALRLFCRIGGRETALSYGIEPAFYERLDYDELGEALRRHVPEEHRAFLGRSEDMVMIGDYAFVHAGVRPNTPLDQQKPSDLRWIREPFLQSSAMMEKMIVHGHTISDTVEEQPHRIGVDTGAYATGRLSALGLEGERRWQLRTGE